ncbi:MULTISPECIES: hypothetical protein [Pseudomonadaceae]|uniref:hypothetical protein n=1 Tax=Pseudomonadaceae TaxID=135621 RepID=UPI00244B9A59|nr:hypothetical protein [Pseudomonas chengduensis]MDH1869223.1 hypothetical protein [Pseudomonas chengduensis]
MRETLHPSVLEPRLTAEYVDVVCNEALDAAYRAIEAASTDDDTPWTLGTLTYGRVQGRFKAMNRDPELPWFRLANNTMDYTTSVNGVLLQVVMDDPIVRKKSHRLSPNGVERFQASLLGLACDQNLTWRLYIDSDLNPDGRKLTATVMGFDSNLNVVCQWVHNYVSLPSVRTTELPQEVEIQDPLPLRRNKDAEQGKLDDTDVKDE